MNPQTPDDNLTVKQTAQLLGYEYFYTHRLIREGVIAKRQRGPGCKITVSRALLEKTYPHKFVKNTLPSA